MTITPRSPWSFLLHCVSFKSPSRLFQVSSKSPSSLLQVSSKSPSSLLQVSSKSPPSLRPCLSTLPATGCNPPEARCRIGHVHVLPDAPRPGSSASSGSAAPRLPLAPPAGRCHHQDAGGRESRSVHGVCIDETHTHTHTHTRFKRRVISHAQDAGSRESRSVQDPNTHTIQTKGNSPCWQEA